MQHSETFEDFRADLRDWLEVNCPTSMRDGSSREEDICWGGKNWLFQSGAQRAWLERMAAMGLTVPTWPQEYGGSGLTRNRNPMIDSRDCAGIDFDNVGAMGADIPGAMDDGIGMTDEFDIGFYMKRARVATEWLGDYDYHANIVARARGF